MNAAPVRGIKDALRSFSNAQWCDPSDRDVGGNGVGSLTVPRIRAMQKRIVRTRISRKRGNARPPGIHVVVVA